MDIITFTQPIFLAAGFSLIVLVVSWIEYRRLRSKLFEHEEQMKRRLYELAILRELGERIGYSLNVQKIVDIISSSLGNLLPYSSVVYMLPQESGRLLFHVTLAESVNKSFVSELRTRMLKSFSILLGKNYTDSDVDESVAGMVTDPTGPKKVQSFFNIPIVINNKPSGVFTVASTKEGLYKTSEEVEILYTIMSQASEAVSKLETVLEIEKGKLNSMVSSMADGVLMVDTNSHVLVINPQALGMLGLEHIENLTFFDVLKILSDHFDLRTKIEESLKKDQLIVENEIQLKEKFMQILITPVKDNKSEPLGSVVIFHDTTDEKELERMREDFTSMMVHELRSPLTGIRSIADLLKTEKIKNEPKKYTEFVNLISTNSSSMLDLVGTLLDVAKLEAGKFEVFETPGDLRKVVKQRIDSFAPLAAENKLTLEQNISPEVPPNIPFDENKLPQVLNNLISNAIKFTSEGGKVTISAFLCKKDQDIARQAADLRLFWHGLHEGPICPLDAVVVSVTDTGLGIPEQEIPKLFNKFQQLSTASRSQKKGTGLGLVVVKGIVQAHGGEVGVFSEEGKGTTVYFTLPINFKK